LSHFAISVQEIGGHFLFGFVVGIPKKLEGCSINWVDGIDY
jgi:hypothetical protein